MTRAEFMGRLRRGLVGMPTAAAADIASDYEVHFEDGLAAGRSEAEVAAGYEALRRHVDDPSTIHAGPAMIQVWARRPADG